MNLRTRLRKSLLIEPAATELRRADTEAELEQAWRDLCSGFALESVERRELFAIYTVRLVTLRKAQMLGKLVRV